MQADFLVVGAGSAGSVLSAELKRRGAGKVLVLEAGRSERHPLVSMPFGLVWLLGGARDWAFRSNPMKGLNGRSIAIPRGRMVGGSGSINSMVWFRGRAQDFDAWQLNGWSGAEVSPAFDAVEAKLRPQVFPSPHPLTAQLQSVLRANDPHPNPDVESAGICSHNLIRGRRNSAATAFLRPSGVEVRTGCEVDCLLWTDDRATGVRLVDDSEIKATKGVVLSAGSLLSPAILMRSGIGPSADLNRLGIDVRLDAPEVGQNLHDHPGIGLHFEGPGTGYGLEPRQWASWAMAPFAYLLGRGRLTSPTVEGAMFFNARGESSEPDVQSHFIPFYLDPKDRKYRATSGYFADVCLCRPRSRGSLTLASKDAKASPIIDLGVFRDGRDLETMVQGVLRLRKLLGTARFGEGKAHEIAPGAEIQAQDLASYIRQNAGTAYHPVGTLRMGDDKEAPISARLAVRGMQGLWVADASVMPKITSANTNAPSMMIGYKGADYIMEDAQ
ncbi:MAG: GMC family oxidoreductase N-terminal domain-containing protein [Pseudomonadota bacterium]